jgi:WD40 repeat protein
MPKSVPLVGHGNQVTSLAFAPDGKMLASRSSDDTVKLWHVPTRRVNQTIPGFPSGMGAIAFSPDGMRLVANEATVGVVSWDVTSDASRSNFIYPERKRPESSCYSLSYGWGLAYSPDGKTLAAGGSNEGDDGFVATWDLTTGEGKDLGYHTSPVTTVAFAPDGSEIASGSTDGMVRIWDLNARKERVCLPKQEGSIYAVCYSPDGTILCANGGNRGVKLWNAATGDELATFSGHREPVRCLALHRGGRIAASGDRAGTTLLWDMSTMHVIDELPSQARGVWSLAFSPIEDLLAAGYEDGTIRLWDLAKLRNLGSK